MTDKEKIMDILLEFYEEYQGNIPNRPIIPSIYANKIIDSLQEESVSIWHDASEEPEYWPVLVIDPVEEGMVINESVLAAGLFNEYNVVKWCYLEDLLHGQEEPVSEELEDFALQYAGHHAPYDDCMQEVVDAIKAGAQWQKQQDTKILESVITNGNDYPTLESFLNTFKMMQYGKIKM